MENFVLISSEVKFIFPCFLEEFFLDRKNFGRDQNKYSEHYFHY